MEYLKWLIFRHVKHIRNSEHKTEHYMPLTRTSLTFDGIIRMTKKLGSVTKEVY